MAFIVSGQPGLLRDLAAQAALLDRASARAAFRGGSRIIALDARSKAPRATGTLQRAIIWFLSKRRGGAGSNRRIESFAWVNVLRGRVKAPHALLVEKGRRPVVPKRRSVLAFSVGRNAIFAQRVRGVAPNRFFERAVQASGDRALDFVVRKLEAIIGTTRDT